MNNIDVGAVPSSSVPPNPQDSDGDGDHEEEEVLPIKQMAQGFLLAHGILLPRQADLGFPSGRPFEGISLDTERRELRRDGDLVAIEPTVFDLLVHLIANRDRVVSKDDLMAAI